MNVYAVTLSCIQHYGNGYMKRETASPQKIVAENGEQAVKKAKAKVSWTKPILEELKILESNVE